nr:hypothetical protein [Neolewinella xylanilytica]
MRDFVVEAWDNTAVLWNRITLTAKVRGNTVTTEFTVTEIYQQRTGHWSMLGMTSSSVRD